VHFKNIKRQGGPKDESRGQRGRGGVKKRTMGRQKAISGERESSKNCKRPRRKGKGAMLSVWQRDRKRKSQGDAFRGDRRTGGCFDCDLSSKNARRGEPGKPPFFSGRKDTDYRSRLKKGLHNDYSNLTKRLSERKRRLRS